MLGLFVEDRLVDLPPDAVALEFPQEAAAVR